MLIAIMSDSHDHLTKIKAAIEIFRRNNVECLIHAGDFIAPFAIPLLGETGASRIEGIYGNNDGEKEGLRIAFSKINGNLYTTPVKLTVDDTGILLMHEPYHIADGLEDGSVRLIIYGHTHRLEIKKQFDKLIINPGETCGWITGRSSVVLLNTETMEAGVVDI